MTRNQAAFARIQDRLKRLIVIPREDLAVLADELELIIIEDNRKGVLEGTDKDGRRMPPLKYRIGVSTRTAARSVKSDAFGTRAKRFKGLTSYSFGGSILPNNNLTTRAYQELYGPRLAPRGEASRVITNLVKLPPTIGINGVTARAGWTDVVSAKGVPFLRRHFDGTGNAPRYDLRGVREWGRRRAREAVTKWARWLLTSTKGR